MAKSDLPFGSEFSPSQIDLVSVLEFAYESGGDWRIFENLIRSEYFELNTTSSDNKAKLANNTKLGMIAYGLINRDANLTTFGKKLYEYRHDESRLYQTFAQHILLNLYGMTLVQCVQDIQAAGERVTLLKLREWLEERGIHFPRGGKHPSIMRLWLEKAGVFTRNWNVDEARLKDVLGASSNEVDVLAMFSPEQKAYLKTLANLGGGSYFSNEIEKLASATYGMKFNEKNLPKQVLYPLRDAGYIELSRGTKKAGRGAKPFRVSATNLLISDLTVPLLEQLEKQVVTDLRPLLRKPLVEILRELESTNKHIRGLALEALAFYLMRLIDLNYVATRLRGSATGGAEVDVIFEGARLVFSRWQVQCKNTSRISLDDVAKEVGLTHFLKSNVIVMVTTGTIGQEARKYANRIIGESNLCIVMIDGTDLSTVVKDPISIVDVFNREAAHAMSLKKLEL